MFYLMHMHRLITIANRMLWLLITAVFGLLITRMINPEFLGNHTEWNQLPAKIASILFLITLLPGVAQRFGLRNMFVRYGVAWRRTIGITMYFFALTHFLFLIDLIPWFSGGFVPSFDVVTASGFTAVILLLPVLLTSNNTSVRFLKRYWKIIQRLTYIALPLIAIHLWNNDETLIAVSYGIVSIIIILSYFMNTYKRDTSLTRTGIVTLAVVAGSAFIAYLSLTLLFKKPNDAAREAAAQKNTLRVEELTTENRQLKSELDETAAQLEEFERIEREKEAALERAAQAQKDEELRIAREKEEAEAEAARVAALQNYVDGTYIASATFVTDKGKLTESIDVTLSLNKDTIQSVSVVGHLEKSKSIKYFGKFENDISGVIVGKKLDTISIGAIGGASDTSEGFRSALQKIRLQAKA